MSTNRDKIERAIEVQEIKQNKRIEEEKLLKELKLLEILFDKIFKKEIEVDFDKGEHLTSVRISSCKSFIQVLLYIYSLEKAIAKDNPFDDNIRKQALKEWYLSVKALSGLSETPTKESLDNIIGKDIADIFKNRVHASLNALLITSKKEIKKAIEAVGLTPVAEYLNCSSTAIHQF
jgi:hypothetical protein